MPDTSLERDDLARVMARLEPVFAELARRYPGDSDQRQPVHVVYGGAQRFAANTVPKLGSLALRAMEEYAPDARTFGDSVGLDPAANVSDDDSFVETIYARVRDKLTREPVEDYRIDFEDGYGVRADAEEDAHAMRGARETATAMREGLLPPWFGIRVKPLTAEHHARSLRTLDLFVTTLVREGAGPPTAFFVTLPKITSVEQVSAFTAVLERLEHRLGLPDGTLRLEAMVETPQLVMDASGRSSLPLLMDAAHGRLVAVHFGAYDYLSALGVAASQQRLGHEACDFTRNAMRVAFAGTSVRLSDGATTLMPVPVHRPTPEGSPLSSQQVEQNRANVHEAWRLHAKNVRHALASGFYQGWDLHPAQLVTRYAAVYAFFLEGLADRAERLRRFIDRAAQASLVGNAFDDAATGQGLLNEFLRAIGCGAIPENDAVAMTGVTHEELRARSFPRILERRRGDHTAHDR